MTHPHTPILLIGGMDSSGGAGLLRDTATAKQLGVAHRVAVTAVTAQSDRAVTAIHPVPPDVIAAQIAVAVQAPIGAVKIGMLGMRRAVEVIAQHLPDAPLVLDPVVQSSSGRDLLAPDALTALLALLLPRASIVTPNLPELSVLATALGHSSSAPPADQARAILSRGCGAVLVKGGHNGHATLSEDILYLGSGEAITLTAPRCAVALRGTGCQLATAIAAHLALGHSMVQAVELAKHMLTTRFRVAAQASQDSVVLA